MSEEYKDMDLVCMCGQPFVWEAGEQKFMNDLAADGKVPTVQIPKRCPACRLKKKQERDAQKQQTQE